MRDVPAVFLSRAGLTSCETFHPACDVLAKVAGGGSHPSDALEYAAKPAHRKKILRRL